MPWREPGTGRVLGVIGVAREVTAWRKAEDRLRETERELSALAHRAAVAAMAGGLAHELAQPLSAAANFLHAARRGPDGAAALLEKAQREVLRAGEILAGMRASLRGGAADRTPLDLARAARAALSLALETRAEAAPPALRFHAAPGLPLVEANATQIEQVIVNLARNAVEAMAGARGAASEARLDVEVGPDGAGGVRVAIADTGPGLPDEVARFPVGTFRSGHDGRAGRGLGLAICRAIVEGHGGTLSLGPRAGGGTVAAFTLPAEAAAGEAGPAEAPTAEPVS